MAEEIEVDPRLVDNSANSSFDTWGAKVIDKTYTSSQTISVDYRLLKI